MRKLMIGAFAALAAAVTARGEDKPFALLNALGEETGRFDTLEESVAGISEANSTIELCRDATFSKPIALNVAAHAGLVLRSRGNSRFVLKRAAADAKWTITGINQWPKLMLSVTNLVIDGGAVWDEPDKLNSFASSGVGAGELMTVGAWRKFAMIDFEDGAEIRNFRPSKSKGIFVMSTGARICMRAGSAVRDCRGGAIAVISGATDCGEDGRNIFTLQGGMVTGCYVGEFGGAGGSGLFSFENLSNARLDEQSKFVFESGMITNNAVSLGAGSRAHGVVSSVLGGRILLGGGRAVTDDNWLYGSNGEKQPAPGLVAFGSSQIQLVAPLTADSKLTAKIVTAITGDVEVERSEGKVFGLASDAKVSMSDCHPELITASADVAWHGWISEGNLIWTQVSHAPVVATVRAPNGVNDVYESLQAAIDDYTGTTEIRLVADVSGATPLTVGGRELKIDLNGHALQWDLSVGDGARVEIVDSLYASPGVSGTVEVTGKGTKLKVGQIVMTGSPAVRFTESAKDAAFYAGGATFVSATGAALEFAGTGDWDLGGTTVTGADGVKVSGGALTMNYATVDVTGTGVLCDKGANAVEVRQDNETAVVKGGVAAYATTAAFDAAVAAGTAYGDVSGGSVSSVVPGSLLDGYTCTQEDEAIVFTPVGNAVRLSLDGGATWTEYETASACAKVFNGQLSDRDIVVELLRDADLVTGFDCYAHQANQTVVFRSDSRKNRRYVLRRAAGHDTQMIRVILWTNRSTLTQAVSVVNLVLDGGAKFTKRWIDPQLSSDELLANEGCSANENAFKTTYANCSLTFGGGALVRNFCCTHLSQLTGGGTVTFADGARMTGMRASDTMFYWPSSCSFRMQGGSIDRCYFKANGGLCSASANSVDLHLSGGEIVENVFATYLLYASGRVDFTGTRIVGNTCQRNSTSYERDYSICVANGYEVSGNPVCWDNYNLAGLNVGLSVEARPIIVTGALGRGARVRFMCPNGQKLEEGGVVSHDGDDTRRSYILNGVDPRGLSHIYNTQTDFAKDVCWVAKRSDVDMLDGTAKKLVYTKPSVCLEPGMVKSAASSAPTLFLSQISRDLKAGRLDVKGTLTLTDTVLELGADVGTLENFKGGVVIPLATAAEIVGFDAFAAANVAALDLPRNWSLQVLPTHDGRQQLCLCRQKQGLMLLVR